MANVKNNASAKETKRRLIEAAGAVFAEHGFERATIKEITDRAGASLASVNYHFSDKQELYDLVVQHVHEAGCPVYEALSGIDPKATPAQRLHLFVERLLRHVLDPTLPDWYGQIKTREMQHPGVITDRFIEQAMRPFTAQLLQLMRDLLATPVPQQELVWLVNSVIAQCIFYAHNRALMVRLHPDQPPASESVPELAAHITRFTLAALSCWSHDGR
jgi:TetR/AcrR family transcriptional regulator, regulator of cefoperazone and chloramphenicol sensitivity